MDMFPQIRLITTDDYIKEINNSIDNHNYLSALVLSLMIPDICSKCIDLENVNDETKYERWFNKYVFKKYYDFPTKRQLKKRNNNNEMYKIKFNGSTCYALRNAILHSGDTHIIYKKDKMRMMANVDSIELCVNGESERDQQRGEGASITKYDSGRKSVSIRINIVLFAEKMIMGYNDFLSENKTNSIRLFNMIDWDKLGGKIIFTPNDTNN